MNLEIESLKVLKQCKKLMRIAQWNTNDLKSPQVSLTPQHGKGGVNNIQEQRIVNRLDARHQLKQIVACLPFIRSDYKELLVRKFMTLEPTTNLAISIDLGIDEGMFYRYRHKALQQFGEAYFGVMADDE